MQELPSGQYCPFNKTANWRGKEKGRLVATCHSSCRMDLSGGCEWRVVLVPIVMSSRKRKTHIQLERLCSTEES